MTRAVVTLALAGLAAAMPAGVGTRIRPAASQTPPAGRADVAIMGAGQLAHASTDPLLLRVHIFNGEAQRTAARNLKHARLAADAAASPRFRTLAATERARLLLPYAPRPVPALDIGPADRGLAAAVRFTIENSRGAAVPLPVRPLASAAARRGVERLDERRSVMLAFGADAAAVAALPAGAYAIRAHVHTGAAPTASRSVVITIGPPPRQEPPAARARRLARSAAFYLEDGAFARAEALARDVIARAETGAEGWVLLGDALDGLGRGQEALDAFLKALDLTNAMKPAPGVEVEPPAYIQDRIVQIQAALQRR